MTDVLVRSSLRLARKCCLFAFCAAASSARQCSPLLLDIRSFSVQVSTCQFTTTCLQLFSIMLRNIPSTISISSTQVVLTIKTYKASDYKETLVNGGGG